MLLIVSLLYLDCVNMVTDCVENVIDYVNIVYRLCQH